MNGFLTKIKNINYQAITHIPYRLFVARPSIKKLYKDERDYKLGFFNWLRAGADYKPDWTRKENLTLSIKDQENNNTCVYNATVASKEPDEGVELSVRAMVSMAKREKLLTGNGWSASNAGMKILEKYGAMEQSLVANENESNWEKYSTMPIDYTNAEKHKIGAYLEIETRDDLIKKIDEGRLPITNLKWFTGFNQGGGFSYPWIISRVIGLPVGWHEIMVKGIDFNYHGIEVAIIQNSYGDTWGDNGKLYVTLDYLLKNKMDILYHEDEIDSEYAKFVHQFDGKTVKGVNSKTFWHLQKGVKKAYLHELDYVVFHPEDPKLENAIIVDDTMLNKVPKGDDMDISKSIHWEVIKNIPKPYNLTRLLNIIDKNK